MIVLTNLSATPAEENYVEPGIHHHTIGFDLGGGGFRTLRLGPSGLVIGDGKATIAIPAEELVKLAEPQLARQRDNATVKELHAGQ